jgi:hypothetical protein
MTRMLKRYAWHLFALVLFILSACVGQPAASITATPDNDPCSSANLPATVKGLNDLTREFDASASRIATSATEQFPAIISDLQRLRRASEDLEVPPCLGTLKKHQLNNMNLTIQALLVFMGGADRETLNSGLALARKEHDLYSLEMVRLLGITLAPVTGTP